MHHESNNCISPTNNLRYLTGAWFGSSSFTVAWESVAAVGIVSIGVGAAPTGLGRRSTVARIANGLTRDPDGESSCVFTSVSSVIHPTMSQYLIYELYKQPSCDDSDVANKWHTYITIMLPPGHHI